jgi:non-ribosomal peptide synthetase component F
LLVVKSGVENPGLLLQYDTSTLSDGHAKNLGGIISQVMRSVLASLEQRVKDIDWLSPENKEDILRWNQKDSLQPKVNSVLDIFHEICVMQPLSLAVCAWDMDLTYSDLDNLSSKLAQHLKSLGVGHKVMVPVCFEKTGWAIIAILAVLKAGGAYVPLDPEIPFQRLQNIVEQVNGQVILASTQQTKLLATLGGVITVSEDTMNNLFIDVKAACTPISPNNVAYVLFTSYVCIISSINCFLFV